MIAEQKVAQKRVTAHEEHQQDQHVQNGRQRLQYLAYVTPHRPTRPRVHQKDGPQRSGGTDVRRLPYQHGYRLQYHNAERYALDHRAFVLQDRRPADPAQFQRQLNADHSQRD